MERGSFDTIVKQVIHPAIMPRLSAPQDCDDGGGGGDGDGDGNDGVHRRCLSGACATKVGHLVFFLVVSIVHSWCWDGVLFGVPK